MTSPTGRAVLIQAIDHPEAIVPFPRSFRWICLAIGLSIFVAASLVGCGRSPTPGHAEALAQAEWSASELDRDARRILIHAGTRLGTVQAVIEMRRPGRVRRSR